MWVKISGISEDWDKSSINMECSLQNDMKGQQGSTLHPFATPCDLSGRANWFPAAEVLWALPEAAGSPISDKHGGWAWFDGETLNFLVYEALIFINCPILLDLIHGLGKYLSLKLPMPRSPFQAERSSRVTSLGEKLTLKVTRKR